MNSISANVSQMRNSSMGYNKARKTPFTVKKKMPKEGKLQPINHNIFASENGNDGARGGSHQPTKKMGKRFGMLTPM